MLWLYILPECYFLYYTLFPMEWKSFRVGSLFLFLLIIEYTAATTFIADLGYAEMSITLK